MPEQEFEIYLAVLSKLLRLSPAQKAAISDELRDHLEQRLADLLQAGKSRDEAIQIAMNEFGDVTGLALDMTRVSRTPMKKIVVRSTIAASVTAASLVVWISMFAPEHRLAAPPTVQAQQAKPVARKADEPTPAVDTETRSLLKDTELFPAFLSEQAEADFTDIPLHELCSFLQEKHGVPIMLHRSALQEDGVATDQQVSLRVSELTFEELLTHVTGPLGLMWEVDDGLIRISTPSHAKMLTRHFNLHPLVERGHSVESLQDVIGLATNDWEEENGFTAIALVGETAVVRQPYHTQRLIARMLAAVEQPDQPVTLLSKCSNRERWLTILREPASCEFIDMPLEEAMGYLTEVHKIPILIDKQAMQEEGVAADQQLTLTIKDRPLGKILDLLFQDFGLTYVLRDGVVLVTTQARASELMTWVVYNIKDLAPTEELQKQLAGAVQRMTSGQWVEADGAGGTLFASDASGCLLIKQTDRAHAEIQALFHQLRRQGVGRVVAADKNVRRSRLVTKYYRMPSEIATDLASSLKSLVEPGQWEPLDGEDRTIFRMASAPDRDEVEGLVSGGSLEVQVLNNDQNKGQPANRPGQPPGHGQSAVKSIVVRPRSVLIIRQTPQVHREIQNFLNKLGIAVQATNLEPGERGVRGPGGMSGGMGGGGMGGGMF